MPKTDPKEPLVDSWRVPKGTTIKLGRQLHRDLWWLGRVTGEEPGEIIERLCGAEIAAARKAREADVVKLRKMDAEEERLREGVAK